MASKPTFSTHTRHREANERTWIDKHVDDSYANAVVLPCYLTSEELELCLARVARK